MKWSITPISSKNPSNKVKNKFLDGKAKCKRPVKVRFSKGSLNVASFSTLNMDEPDQYLKKKIENNRCKLDSDVAYSHVDLNLKYILKRLYEI